MPERISAGDCLDFQVSLAIALVQDVLSVYDSFLRSFSLLIFYELEWNRLGDLRATQPSFIWPMDPLLSKLDHLEHPLLCREKSSSTRAWWDTLKPSRIPLTEVKFWF